MGCSASRHSTFLTNTEDPSSFCSNSSFESYDVSSPHVKRAHPLSTPLVHHPPLRKGDTHHIVSLTSTTYGSLQLIDSYNEKNPDGNFNKKQHQGLRCESLSQPDNVINTWELMHGLEDEIEKPTSELYNNGFKNEALRKPSSCRYTEFDGSNKVKFLDTFETVKVSRPLWKHLSEESLLAKMDSNVVSSYRRALSARQMGYNQIKVIREEIVPDNLSSLFPYGEFMFPVFGDRIVLYFTSLRGIRKTYEDCYAVRMIFRGFRVVVDERDVSMDSKYRKELQGALRGKVGCLPQVFIRGRYIGGVEEVKQLNEAGELGKLLEGFPIQDPLLICQRCGEARFVPCPNCNGSRKIFDIDQHRFTRCPGCNENGLIRCPGCCL